MNPPNMEAEKYDEVAADPLSFARSYQVEALEKAIKQNTIVFLETGSGKTMISIMLLRSYAHLFRKPSRNFAVFLVPQVVLVTQQAGAVEMHTDLKVGKYWGDMGVDFWDAAMWKQQINKHEVLVMTPAILLNCLRHAFFKLSMIKVLIIDECHHARGNHPYASIMREFYHSQLKSRICNLPRIFGMTASPIKTKGAKSSGDYWQKIRELETLMNSKVYTCSSESVLTEFIPFSTPKLRSYQQVHIPYALYNCLVDQLNVLTAKHQQLLGKLGFSNSLMDSIEKKISKINSTLLYCLTELGAWLAMKAAQSLSSNASDILSWGKMDISGDKFVRKFCQDVFEAFLAYITSDPKWTIGDDVKAHVDAGLLTNKIACLIDCLLEYSALKDIRCIVFVERVITAIVLDSLLTGVLSRHTNWRTKYIAGNNSGLQSQTRKTQNEIVEEFRKGMVNIIIATSILEEGLDVQNCNLVIRFDPSATVCSFIQSRGRARMQNSDYILMVKSGDSSTIARLENYLSSGDIMRKESLRHASVPCAPLDALPNKEFYSVASTGAIVTRSSSVSLIYFYCSRLPSDGYFKPAPRCDICEEKGICTLYLPKSCPIQTVSVQGNTNTLKQTACLEAVKKLHEVGALTDNLVPDIVVEEEAAAEELGKKIHNEEQPIYFPPELVSPGPEHSEMIYHCYVIELNQNFNADILTQDILLGTRTELSPDIRSMGFDLDVDGSILSVALKYLGVINLSREQVLLCKRFQITIFKVLMKYTTDKIVEVLDRVQSTNKLEIDYLILPSNDLHQEPLINWNLIRSVLSSSHHCCLNPAVKGGAHLHTKNGLACTCTIKNSLVYTPHNGRFYCITDILDDLNAYSLMNPGDGNVISYKHYFERRHGIQISFVHEPLLEGRHMFNLQNYLIGFRKQKEKCLEPSRYVELPAELCYIIMSPISVRTVYSFTFIPSIMHRLKSLLIAVNLRKIHSDNWMQNVDIPTMKVLEAITTKECQEKFHLESLETLGDSFLKYAATQQLFKAYQNNHEGLLSVKRERIISNASLCKLGCDRKLPGFIHTEIFDPGKWMVPGENSESYDLTEECFSKSVKMYVKGNRNVKIKRIADVVEALIGAYLSSGGEFAALLFMNWVGIEVNFANVPYERNFLACVGKYINVRHLESLLNYSFKDPSLLMEALTHGSYMLPEICQCYQRLEFLGDAVLDYLVTAHLYKKYPGISPGLLTDMRSASTNNGCYARCAVKAGLHKHICHLSHELHKQIATIVYNLENLSSHSDTTFGWDSEECFPKVLGDVIESLAGAIFVDSGYNMDVAFKSIRPLLEPMITPEKIKFHPVRELTELCQKQHFEMKKLVSSRKDNMASVTVHVEANGVQFIHTSTAGDQWLAKRLASKQVLKALKERIMETE